MPFGGWRMSWKSFWLGPIAGHAHAQPLIIEEERPPWEMGGAFGGAGRRVDGMFGAVAGTSPLASQARGSVRVWTKLNPVEAVGLMSGLYRVNRLQVARAAAEGGDPLAVLHGLQRGTIKYIRADKTEHWKTRNQILEDGGGDCEDLANAIAAELNETVFADGFGAAAPPGAPLPPPPTPVREPMPSWGWVPGSRLAHSDAELYARGMKNEAITTTYKAQPGLYHVVVWTPTWGYIDPSVAGGMGRY